MPTTQRSDACSSRRYLAYGDEEYDLIVAHDLQPRLQDLPLLVGKVHVRPPASMTGRETLYGLWHAYEIASS